MEKPNTFRWTQRPSEKSYARHNYVEKIPAPTKIDSIYNDIKSLNADLDPNPNFFDNVFRRNVQTAKHMLRSAADQAIAKYGLTDSSTRRLIEITSNPEEEDKILKRYLDPDEVDNERLRQNRIDLKVGGSSSIISDYDRAIDNPRKQEMLDQMELDNQPLGALRDMATAGYPGLSSPLPTDPYNRTETSQSESRAVAAAVINKYKKQDPDSWYLNLNSFNEWMDKNKLPVPVKQEALKLAKSEYKQHEADKYFNEINELHANTPDYYVPEAAGKDKEKMESYLDSLKSELEKEKSQKLEAYRQKLLQWKAINEPKVKGSIIGVTALNTEYKKALTSMEQQLHNEMASSYERMLPINYNDVQLLKDNLKKMNVYNMEPEDAAMYLGAYRKQLLEKKLLENPKMDQDAFNSIWHKVATEAIHLDNNRMTPVGIKMGVAVRKNLAYRIGIDEDEWATAFGIGSVEDRTGKELVDAENAAKLSGLLGGGMEAMGVTGGAVKVAAGLYDKVANDWRSIIGSIGTMMQSDSNNDEELAAIKNKLANKVSLTFDEKMLLDAINYKQLNAQMSGKDDPYYRGGQAVTDMIPYTLQFMLGNKVMSLAGFSGKLAPVFRAVEGQKLGFTTRSLNVLKNFGTQLGQAGAITAAFPQMGKMNTNRRRYADVSTINEDGIYVHQYNENDPVEAGVKGYTESLIDNYTEMLGVGIDRGMHYVGAGVKKIQPLNKLIAKADDVANKIPLVKTMAGLTFRGASYAEKNAAKGVREMMQLGKMNGIIGEYLEEEASRNLGAIINGDNNGELQFMDSEFLKETGSSVAAYSMLSGGLFSGINSLNKSTTVKVPTYDSNGNLSGTERLRINKNALAAIHDLNDREELTEESLQSVSTKLSGKQRTFVENYGRSLMERKKEKQEVSDSKESLLSEGFTENQVQSFQSLAQVERARSMKEAIDAGYASIDEHGYVSYNAKQLDRDIEKLNEELSTAKEGSAGSDVVQDLTTKVETLKQIKKNVVEKSNQTLRTLAGVDGEQSLSDAMNKMLDLNDRLIELQSQPASNSREMEAKNISSAMSMLFNAIYGTVKEKGVESSVVDELSASIAEKEAAIEELKKKKEDLAENPDEIGKIESQIQEATASHTRQSKMLEMMLDISNQVSADRIEEQQVEDIDEAYDDAINLSDEEKPDNDLLNPASKDSAPRSIPDGELMIGRMISIDENGKVTGDKKKIATVLSRAIDLPVEAKLKISTANKTVTAHIEYKGRKLSYNLLAKTPTGLIEASKESLTINLSNAFMAIDREEDLLSTKKEMEKIQQKVEENKNDIIESVLDVYSLESFSARLYDHLPNKQAARLEKELKALHEKFGNTYSLSKLLSIVLLSAEQQGTPILKRESLANLISVLSQPPTGKESKDNEVKREVPKQRSEQLSTVIILTANSIENSITKEVEKDLKNEIGSRERQLALNIEKAKIILNSQAGSLEAIDKRIGNAEQYEKWLLRNESTKKEFSISYNVYQGIRTRDGKSYVTLQQKYTIKLLANMGLVDGSIPSTVWEANEVIHRGILRMYAVLVGTESTPSDRSDELSGYIKHFNSIRTVTRELAMLQRTAYSINKMVTAYNLCYASKNGVEMKLPSEQADIIKATAADILTELSKNMEEFNRYYLDRIYESNQDNVRKPNMPMIAGTDKMAKRIVAYANRLVEELDGIDYATLQQEINDMVARLSNALNTARRISEEINPKKSVRPMIGGISTSSPALKGTTVTECLQAIADGNGENAAFARHFLSMKMGDLRIVPMEQDAFDRMLDKNGLNHNTVAFTDGSLIYINKNSGMTEHALLHELSHVRTMAAIEMNTPEAQQLEKEFIALKTHMLSKRLINGSEYGFTNLHEFLAELHSNSAFMRMVKNADEPSTLLGKLWDAIVRRVRSLVGLPSKVSRYDRIIFLSDELMEANELLLPLVQHEGNHTQNMLLALEQQGTPLQQKARAIFIKLMLKADKLNARASRTLSYLGYEEQLLDIIKNMPGIVEEAMNEVGIKDYTLEQISDEVISYMGKNSLFRYQIASYRIRQYQKQKYGSANLYEASESGAAASSEDRLKAQQKAFLPLVKRLTVLLNTTRDEIDVQLINRLKSKDALEATRNENSYNIWLSNLEDEDNASVFDKALAQALSEWDYKSYVSASVFYNSLRTERHLKIMFDSDGNPMVETINSGGNLKSITNKFSFHINSFVATNVPFLFGRQNGRMTNEQMLSYVPPKATRYVGMDGMLRYVAAVRAGVRDDFKQKRTTRVDEYKRELNVLKNLTGIDASTWDVLLSENGYDNVKTVQMTIGGSKSYVKVDFGSYKNFCIVMDGIVSLCRARLNERQPMPTVGEIESQFGITISTNDKEQSLFLNDLNSYFSASSVSQMLADSLPFSVMTNSILSKLDRYELLKSAGLNENSPKKDIDTYAMIRLTSLFVGGTNDQGENVKSNLDALSSAVSAKSAITSSGFGVDNNRISGVALNSSMHHIAENILNIKVDNPLVEFYKEKGTSATPVVLNGMVSLSDRDNATLFNDLNDVDYWKSQMVLYLDGNEESYYASMGVFSDKGRGLFIEAPKRKVSWSDNNKSQASKNFFSTYTNHSGGAIGADSMFDTIGKKYGQNKHNHYYYGNKTPKGNVLLTEEQVQEGVEHMNKAAIILNKFPKKKETINLLARNWFQVKNSTQIVAIAAIDKSMKFVEGGTGWAVAMAQGTDKEINVFNLKDNSWYKWNGSIFEKSETPVLHKNFAGIGSRQDNGKMTKESIEAINSVYENTINNSQNSNASFNEHDEIAELFPDFDESLSYFLEKYASKIVPKSLHLTTEMERRLATEFFVSFVLNIKDINEIFQGKGYKNLTDMVKRGAPVISPGYNPNTIVEDGLGESYTHMVISDIIDIDELTGEYELANGIQFATREWFDKLSNSIGSVYSREDKYGKLSSTKALTTGINPENGLRFLTKTNIICIDDVAESLGGRWKRLADFMHQHGVDTVSSPSGTKKNSYVPQGLEHLQLNTGTEEKPSYDGAFNFFGLDESSYSEDEVRSFVQPYRTNDLYVQQDLRHETKPSWSKQSKQQRMNMTSITSWSPLYENIINSQISKRIELFNSSYNMASTDEERKLILAASIVDKDAFLRKPITSMDDIAELIANDRLSLEDEDMEKLLAIMNPDAQLSFPSIAKWVRSKLSSAMRSGVIEVKVNRIATQELPDLNQEHIGYKVIDKDSWSLAPFFEQAGIPFDLTPSIQLAEASTSDYYYGTKQAMREQKRYMVKNGESVIQTLFRALSDATSYVDMYHLNEDGSLPTIEPFNGTVPSMFKLHELRYEKDADGKEYIVVPGEPFVTNRVPGSSLVSHSVVRLKKSFKSNINYTIINVQAQLASGSDFDGDARYNQLLAKDKRSGAVVFNKTLNGLNNQMVLIAAEAYSRVENYDRIIRPLNVDYADTSVDAIRLKRMNSVSEKDRYGYKGKYHILDPIGYQDARVKNAAGVKMKAIMANLNSAFSYLKFAKATISESVKKTMEGKWLKKEYNQEAWEKVHGSKPMPENSIFEMGNIVEDRYDIVKKVIENELNKAFDNAKDPKIEDEGITEYTANLFTLLLSTSKTLNDYEEKLYEYMSTHSNWKDQRKALDRYFEMATLEADAVFNLLNSKIVQRFIEISRSSSVGKYISYDDAISMLRKEYAEVHGGDAQITKLERVLGYANDFTTIQRAVNASDTNMGTVADFVDYARSISDIISNKLRYFSIPNVSWNNIPSWLKGSFDNISLHANVLYKTSVEYHPNFISASKIAQQLLSRGDKIHITRSMKNTITNALLQVISCSGVYNVSFPALEAALVDQLGDMIAKGSNDFTKQLMLSGMPGSYSISSINGSLKTALEPHELIRVREAFKRMTNGKYISSDVHPRMPLDHAILLYQLIKYGNQSSRGGFMDYIADETVASYSKMSNEWLPYNESLLAASAFAAYQVATRHNVSKSTFARIAGMVGMNSSFFTSSYDANYWESIGRRLSSSAIMVDKMTSNSIQRIPVDLIDRILSTNMKGFTNDDVSEMLNDINLQTLESAIDAFIEDYKGKEPVGRAKALSILAEKRRKNPGIVESMQYNMSAGENIYGEDTSTAKLIQEGKRTATTRSFPLAYMMGDNFVLMDGMSKIVNRVFTFKEVPNKYFAVKSVDILSVASVFDPEFIERWSKKEGWTTDQFMKRIAPRLIAGDILYQTTFEEISKEDYDQAMASDMKHDFYKEREVVPQEIAEEQNKREQDLAVKLEEKLDENAKNSITLEDLKTRVNELEQQGFTEDEALSAIARNLNCL